MFGRCCTATSFHAICAFPFGGVMKGTHNGEKKASVVQRSRAAVIEGEAGGWAGNMAEAVVVVMVGGYVCRCSHD